MSPDGMKIVQTRATEPGHGAETPEFRLAEARRAADFLKAMGHEGRLLMLCHLCDGDLTVTELEQLIMSRQAAVSQQLARLRHEKLVTTRRDGNQIIYSLADSRVREMVLVIRTLFAHS